MPFTFILVVDICSEFTFFFMKRSLLQKLSNVDDRKTYLRLHQPNKSQPRSFNWAINGTKFLHPLCMDTELGWLFWTRTSLSDSHACKFNLISHIFDYHNIASIPIKDIYLKIYFVFLYVVISILQSPWKSVKNMVAEERRTMTQTRKVMVQMSVQIEESPIPLQLILAFEGVQEMHHQHY